MKATESWSTTMNGDYGLLSHNSQVVHFDQYTSELSSLGQGSPIVMVPGLAGGIGLLDPLAKRIAERCRVFAYQLRGENDCFILRHPFDLDDLVDDLAELFDKLKLEQPTLMGVSFGGVIALKFAIRYPYRVGRLIVQGVGALYESGLIHQIAGTVLSRFPLPNDSPFVNQFFNLLFGGRQKQDVLRDFIIRQVWQTDQSVMAHRFRLIEGLDLQSDLHRIKAPTMILSGDRDVFVSATSLDALVRGLPKAKVHRLPDAGHLAFVTKPDLVAQRVHSFCGV
ncbi:MAG: alpha/beta hydrolase [Gemmataceae bacterium]|nr:alpha/beta hydrolase [Gemmataceae bacterium]